MKILDQQRPFPERIQYFAGLRNLDTALQEEELARAARAAKRKAGGAVGSVLIAVWCTWARANSTFNNGYLMAKAARSWKIPGNIGPCD
jgi:hypothetical protein